MGQKATAVWFPAARKVELQEEELSPPGPSEIEIQALASGVSAGTELLVFRGQVAPDLPLDLPTLRGAFSFPIKYGYASVGSVVAVGREVKQVLVGDEVFVHHPHQSRYVVPAEAAVRLPSGVEPELGVFLANLETAINVILDANPKLGERVLIFGQGVVGLLLAQLLRRTGVSLVATVEPAAKRAEMSGLAGADVVLSPHGDLEASIAELTAGAGFDLVIESSGNPEALGQAIDAAAFQSTIVVCSWYGTKPASVPLGGAFHRQRLRLLSSQVGTLDPALTPRWNRERRLQLARDLLGELQLAPLITHRFPLRRAEEAYRLLDKHAEEAVQVVLTYGADVV